MSAPLVTSLVITALSLAGHVRPRFGPDAELLAAGPRHAWTRSGLPQSPLMLLLQIGLCERRSLRAATNRDFTRSRATFPMTSLATVPR